MALSGGGDSLALTLIADAWARARGRELLILTVDHGLRPESVFWTRRCAALAERLGRPFRALTWEGEKPATGLPAAARAARHRLLADATRDGGANVILMGHTADDIAEAHAMRAAGSTTPDPREWAPSPVWPEGRGVFVLRPMLKQRRADLRAWLEARDESWIDDSANDDLRFARGRARAGGASAVVASSDVQPSQLFRLADHFEGAITIYRKTLRAASPADVVRFAAIACVCAGGGERRPMTERLQRLANALHGEGAFVATLAGARVEATESHVDIFREAGEFSRRGTSSLPLPAGREVVWDGRYAVTANRAGLAIRPVAGAVSALRPEERSAFPFFSARRRGAFPAVVYPDGEVSMPLIGWSREDVAVQSIVRARFEAAAGLVQREPA